MNKIITKFSAFGLLVFLTACGNSLDFTSPESTEKSYQKISNEIDKKVPGAGLALGRALYRLATPADLAFPTDNFDPLKQIALKTDRQEPKVLSLEWSKKISDELHKKYDGMNASQIMELYYTQDLQALNQQNDWAKSFENRAKQRMKMAQFEESRRNSLIDRITPTQSGYRWTLQEPRVPVIDFVIFNPLDRQISTVDFKIDLISPKNEVVGSGILSYTPMVSIAPGATSNYTASVKDIPGLNNKTFMDLRDPLRVSMKIDNVYVGNKEPIVKDAISTSLDKQRQDAVENVLTSIQSEKANLFKYRVLADKIKK